MGKPDYRRFPTVRATRSCLRDGRMIPASCYRLLPAVAMQGSHRIDSIGAAPFHQADVVASIGRHGGHLVLRQ
ncbi:MAG: hypothetical protein JWQ86_973 [Mycobacterium sp.]|nr:hypothetical protein [Mycobacterium sp.]